MVSVSFEKVMSLTRQMSRSANMLRTLILKVTSFLWNDWTLRTRTLNELNRRFYWKGEQARIASWSCLCHSLSASRFVYSILFFLKNILITSSPITRTLTRTTCYNDNFFHLPNDLVFFILRIIHLIDYCYIFNCFASSDHLTNISNINGCSMLFYCSCSAFSLKIKDNIFSCWNIFKRFYDCPKKYSFFRKRISILGRIGFSCLYSFYTLFFY